MGERIELEIDGTAYDTHRVEGSIWVSELFELQAELTCSTPPGDLLGKAFKLTLHNEFDETWLLTGVVFGVDRDLQLEGGTLHLELAPDVARLNVGRDSRVFQDMDAKEVIQSVLDHAGVVAYELRISGSYAKRPYTVQYQESDWSFIERIAAEVGIYYHFEFRETETLLVFQDASTDAPAVGGEREFVEVDPNAMHHEATNLTSIKASWSSTSTATRIVDYDHTKPNVELVGQAEAGDALHEIYEYTGRSNEPEEVDAAARMLLECCAAERLLLQASTACLRLRPGLVFDLGSARNVDLEGCYFVRDARISVVERGEANQASLRADRAERADVARAREGVTVTLRAQPSQTPFRSPVRDRVRYMPGPQSGVVCGPSGQELHTGDDGRVRVQPYWDREGQRDAASTTWMRVGQLPLGGSMVLPRVGWDVLMEFHHDDVDQPFVTGHLYDGEHPVPYALPENKTRTAWQTATTPGDGTASEIRFEDKAGSEELFVNATKDMTVSVGDCSTGKIGANHSHEVGANRTIDVGSNAQNAVTGDQSMSVGASESLTVTGNHQATIGGSDSVSIGASRSATVTMGCNLQAEGGRDLCVGGSMLGVSGMEVSRTTMGTSNISVGGSWIMAAATDVSVATAGASSETVGGAKIQAAGSGVTTNTLGALAENVGGAYISVAGGDAAESSGGPLVFNVGGAFVAAGPKIYIKAKSKIVVRVGGASLTMTGSKVKISAPSLASPGATISKSGGTVKHN